MKTAHAYDPGRLSHVVTLIEPQEVSDDFGSIITTWVNKGKIWANIQPLAGRSNFKAQQDMEETSHKIIIRARADVASAWRILKDDRVFAIQTLHDPDETARYLLCYCKEEGR